MIDGRGRYSDDQLAALSEQTSAATGQRGVLVGRYVLQDREHRNRVEVHSGPLVSEHNLWKLSSDKTNVGKLYRMIEFEVRVQTDRLAKPVDLAKQSSVSAPNVQEAPALRYVAALWMRHCCNARSRSVMGLPGPPYIISERELNAVGATARALKNVSRPLHEVNVKQACRE